VAEGLRVPSFACIGGEDDETTSAIWENHRASRAADETSAMAWPTQQHTSLMRSTMGGNASSSLVVLAVVINWHGPGPWNRGHASDGAVDSDRPTCEAISSSIVGRPHQGNPSLGGSKWSGGKTPMVPKPLATGRIVTQSNLSGILLGIPERSELAAGAILARSLRHTSGTIAQKSNKGTSSAANDPELGL